MFVFSHIFRLYLRPTSFGPCFSCFRWNLFGWLFCYICLLNLFLFSYMSRLYLRPTSFLKTLFFLLQMICVWLVVLLRLFLEFVSFVVCFFYCLFVLLFVFSHIFRLYLRPTSFGPCFSCFRWRIFGRLFCLRLFVDFFVLLFLLVCLCSHIFSGWDLLPLDLVFLASDDNPSLRPMFSDSLSDKSYNLSSFYNQQKSIIFVRISLN